MKRLLATLWCDIRLQARGGFYGVTLFMLAIWGLLRTQLPAVDFSAYLPPMLLGNLIINTFYFTGGLVLLEKAEGTLQAQVMTPLRWGEYLLSKLLSLTVLSLLENTILALFFAGFHFSLLPLLAGLSLASALFILAGFIVIARYDAINEYLLPSMGYVLLLMLPLFGYFGLGPGLLYYLHPLQAALLLAQAAFSPLAAWQWIYCLVSAIVWLALAWYASGKTFAKFVILSQGVH